MDVSADTTQFLPTISSPTVSLATTAFNNPQLFETRGFRPVFLPFSSSQTAPQLTTTQFVQNLNDLNEKMLTSQVNNAIGIINERLMNEQKDDKQMEAD